MSILTKIRSLFPKPALEITFTPETPQREKVARKPWWKEEHADQAKQLIHDEAIRRGERSPFETKDGYHSGGYGSGWFIEFPRYVAILIAEQGVETATEYVKRTFDQEDTRDAFDKLRERNPDENFCVASYG